MPDPIVLTNVPIAAAWNVQGDTSSADFVDQVSRQFSIALPIVPNTTARSDALTAFWLGPCSWILVAHKQESPLTDFIDKRDALNRAGGALFDLSASRVAYQIAGDHAVFILASNCPLDLHSRTFRAGDCAQSVFGRVNALLYKPDETPTFIVMVARSFARDVSRALRQSAAQYGYRST